MKTITIGRSPENDICLQDATVSRKHATLVISDNNIKLIDHNSSNGVSGH